MVWLSHEFRGKRWAVRSDKSIGGSDKSFEFIGGAI